MLAIITPVGPEGPVLRAQKTIEGASLGDLLQQAAEHVEALKAKDPKLAVAGADISYHAIGGPAVFRLRGERL